MKLAPQLISTLRKRAACDERATVRKASIAGLTSMLLVMDGDFTSCLAQTCPSQDDIVIFCRLCGDQSVATRKAAAEALATLVKNQYSKGGASLLESAFAEAVLPLVLDAETTCVSKAVDLFCEVVLDPIIEVGGRTIDWNSDYQKNRYMTAWKVLARISEASNESGASKGGTRALKVALTKVFDDAGTSHGNVSKPLLKEVHRVAASSLELEGSSSDDIDDIASNVKSKKEESNDDPVRGLRVRPSSRLINLIQLVLPSHLPPVDEASPATTPQTARALGFVSLGKLCLRDERLAKDCLNILARELNQETDVNDPSVQSNVLLVLGDLCIKYTNLVDKFLPVMVSSLS